MDINELIEKIMAGQDEVIYASIDEDGECEITDDPDLTGSIQ